MWAPLRMARKYTPKVHLFSELQHFADSLYHQVANSSCRDIKVSFMEKFRQTRGVNGIFFQIKLNVHTNQQTNCKNKKQNGHHLRNWIYWHSCKFKEQVTNIFFQIHENYCDAVKRQIKAIRSTFKELTRVLQKHFGNI